MTIVWPGGKRRLAPYIARVCDSFNHVRFVETFCGMADVFFSKRPAEVNVLNDLNDWPLLLFRIARDNPIEYVTRLMTVLRGRCLYDYLKNGYPWKDEDELTRAVNLTVLAHLSFGKNGPWVQDSRQGFNGFSAAGGKHRFVTPSIDRIYTVHRKLQDRIVFENDDYKAILKRYDAVGTLFYNDPPYSGTRIGDGYIGGFSNEDFIKALKNVKHADLIVSHGDTLKEPLEGIGFRQVLDTETLNLRSSKSPEYLSVRRAKGDTVELTSTGRVVRTGFHSGRKVRTLG